MFRVSGILTEKNWLNAEHPQEFLSVCLSLSVSVCLSICLSVCLSVRPSVHPSLSLSLSLSLQRFMVSDSECLCSSLLMYISVLVGFWQTCLQRLRTVNVDVDSHGRSCKERMMSVLCDTSTVPCWYFVYDFLSLLTILYFDTVVWAQPSWNRGLSTL